MRWVRLLSVVTLTLVAMPAVSGPPLTTDDPNVVGKGRTEFIGGAGGLQRSASERSWAAPILCLTYGPTSWMDVGVQSVLTSGSADSDAITIIAGTKWAPVQRDGIVFAVAPSFGVDTKAPGNEFVYLAAQVEVGIGRWQVGTEVVHQALRSQDDSWRAGAYASRRATSRVSLLAELYTQELDPGRDIAATVGAEISLANRLVLLVSVGAGLAADEVKRLEWTGYLGLQKNF